MTNRYSYVLVTALASSALLVGCGQSGGAETAPATTVTTTITPTPSRSNSSSATPSPTTTTSAAPSSEGIELTSRGVGSIPFDTPGDDAEQQLMAMLGPPDNTSDPWTGVPVCDTKAAGGRARVLSWGQLHIGLTTVTEAGSPGRYRLTTWTLNAGPGQPAWGRGAVAVPQAVAAGTTWSEIEASGLTVVVGAMGGNEATTSDGLTYWGNAESSTPSFVRAGIPWSCE